MSEPARNDPPKDIKSIWLDITNVCDRGKFKVYLSINGKEYREFFHCYPNQSDGIVSQGHNLTWIFDAGFQEAVRMLKSKDADKYEDSMLGYAASPEEWGLWLEAQRKKE